MSCLLLVDDDADLRAAVAFALEHAGYKTRQAVGGAEALELADEHLPSAVLLDCRMPLLDGRGFLEGRRTRPRLEQVPVVLVSALRGECESLSAEFANVSWLLKPFSMAEIRAVVARVAPAAAQDGEVV